MSWRDFPYFKPSTPRTTIGGIKAQSKQGSFGRSWWAKRWIAVLDGFQIGAGQFAVEGGIADLFERKSIVRRIGVHELDGGLHGAGHDPN